MNGTDSGGNGSGGFRIQLEGFCTTTVTFVGSYKGVQSKYVFCFHFYLMCDYSRKLLHEMNSTLFNYNFSVQLLIFYLNDKLQAKLF